MTAGAPLNRLGFARWITDRNAPTTARAVVNRVWQSYFGTGLVAHRKTSALRVNAFRILSCSIGWQADFMENG